MALISGSLEPGVGVGQTNSISSVGDGDGRGVGDRHHGGNHDGDTVVEVVMEDVERVGVEMCVGSLVALESGGKRMTEHSQSSHTQKLPRQKSLWRSEVRAPHTTSRLHRGPEDILLISGVRACTCVSVSE